MLSKNEKKKIIFLYFFKGDGNLYAMGKNEHGQCGTGPNVVIRTDLVVWIPTPVIDRHFKGQKIVDFDTGENTLVILTGFLTIIFFYLLLFFN